MKPTPTQIVAEAKNLETMLPKIPQFNIFGEDNHTAIRAEIEVLEERLDINDIDRKADSGEWSQNAADSARDALDWMDGHSEDSPTTSWAALL